MTFNRNALFTFAIFFSSQTLQAETPFVRVETNQGSFTLQLDPVKAPKTVENFLTYLTEGFYANTLVHRSVKNFVVQGGGFDAASFNQKTTRAPITNEANNGLSNIRGTIAMARTNDPNSATSQFFINVGDNRGVLDYGSPAPNQAGYAVFGKVVDGMAVVDTINNLPAASTQFANVKQVFQDMPVVDKSSQTFVSIQKMSRVLPIADAGTPASVESGSTVTLNGSASSDSTPGASGVLSYQWTQTGGPAVNLTDGGQGPTPSFTAPTVAADATLSFQLVVTNSFGNSSNNAAKVDIAVKAVADVPNGSLDPNCAAAVAKPSVLWPPRKSLKPITIDGIASAAPYELTITGVTSDEPVRSKAGKDSTGPDARVKRRKAKSANSNQAWVVSVRAERQFNANAKLAAFNGRVYTVSFSASNGTNTCTGTVNVSVPLQKGGSTIQDDLVYDATRQR